MTRCYICDSKLSEIEFENDKYLVAPCNHCLSEIQEMVSERNIEDLFLDKDNHAFRIKPDGNK